MIRRLHITWQLGRPYFHRPWPERLPGVRDWALLLFGVAMLAFTFKQYFHLGIASGWQVAFQAFATDTYHNIREAWHG